MIQSTASIFPTILGDCGIAWTRAGISRVFLPGAKKSDLQLMFEKARAELSLQAPPPAIQTLISRMQRHLDGEVNDFADVVIDLNNQTACSRRIYQSARAVKPGRIITYGALADRCGLPGGGRAVGRAMAHNQLPLIVPCHRVIAADGGLGGFSAAGRQKTKLRLLSIEGVDLKPIAKAGVTALKKNDSKLASLIRRIGPFRLVDYRPPDPFTALVQSIVHQQVSMKAGAAIFGRLKQAVGEKDAISVERLLDADESTLRSSGLSRQKSSYLRDLAEKTDHGVIDFSKLVYQDDERVIETLVKVKGIGRWSAEMFLIFQLGRLNVLPVGDLGLRRAVQQVYRLRELPKAQRLFQIAEKWQPFCSIATWYLWRFSDAGGLAW